MPELFADFPDKLSFLFDPYRYKVAHGGRYGLKSWSFARALLIQGTKKPLRILCARETQKSIADSVHRLLSDQIDLLGIKEYYEIQKACIIGRNGTEFAFAGIRQNVHNIKSFEGFDIVWVEEAQTVSKHSWNVLIPTIRKEGSEIWVSFNEELEADDTYQRFIVRPPTNSKVVHTTWKDNPWVSEVMRQEITDLQTRDPEEYEHIYGGTCRQSVHGAIYAPELNLAEREGRLTRVPYDAQQPVFTFWDLGFGDSTTVWFGQSVGFEFHWIDYISGELQALAYYIKQLQERPYIYACHYLPWDGASKELGTGRSIQEQMQAIFGHDRVKCAKRLEVVDGIAAVRLIFGRSWFDREKCADGLQALRHYRYERDEQLGAFKRSPLHDWASHGADGFRTAAVSIKEVQRPEPQVQSPPSLGWSRQTEAAWMG